MSVAVDKGPLLALDGVAAHLHVSAKTARRFAKCADLPLFYLVGLGPYAWQRDVDAWVERTKTPFRVAVSTPPVRDRQGHSLPPQGLRRSG